MTRKKLYHLLKPGKFKTECGASPVNNDVTIYKSKATCANCLHIPVECIPNHPDHGKLEKFASDWKEETP